MKILYVIESLGRAGAEYSLVNLIPDLQRRGHQCEVAALWSPYDLAENLEKVGIVVHRLNLSHRWNVVQGITKMIALCYSSQYDVIHANLFFGGLYTAMSLPLARSPKRVVTFRNLAYDSYPANTLWRKVRKFLDSWLMRHWMDGWVAISHAVADHYEKHLGVSGIIVIANAFALDSISPVANIERTTVLSQYMSSTEEFVIVMPGRLVHEKGHRFLIQALSLLGEKGLRPKVLVFGQGPLAKQISEEVANKDLQGQIIIFNRSLPQYELFSVMQVADAVVMPSTHEGFGRVAAEAMALETPVLATRVGGLIDVIEDNVSGLLVQSQDPAALAEGIERLMSDGALRARLGEAGRQRVEEHFSADILAAKWETYYENLIGKNA